MARRTDTEIRRQRREITAMLTKRHAPTAIVDVLLAKADDHARRAMAGQWLREEVARQAREGVRDIERQEFEQRPTPAPKPSPTERRKARREREAEIQALVENRAAPIRAAMQFTRAFLDSTFAIGSGRTVTWGDATVDDHHARMEMLSSQAAGIQEAVGRHEEILSLLVQTGAKCLNDLREEAA